MHRIDTSTAQKDKFGAGKDGFTLGDAQTGVPPTEVSADILDAMQEEICAVVEGSGLLLDKTNNRQLLLAIKKIASSRYFSAGDPLPTYNIGPIWHDDYASWMIWQEFTANGANYSGYASQLIGSLLLDTQPTPRNGYIKSGVQNLSRATYAALRAWAMHNGRMVAPGAWLAGHIHCADNADGTTFRIFDVRGEFLRAWDDERGVDAGRAFGSLQTDAIRNIEGAITVTSNDQNSSYIPVSGQSGALASRGSYGTSAVSMSGTPLNRPGGISFDASRVVPTASENRPRSTSLLATIKF